MEVNDKRVGGKYAAGAGAELGLKGGKMAVEAREAVLVGEVELEGGRVVEEKRMFGQRVGSLRREPVVQYVDLVGSLL